MKNNMLPTKPDWAVFEKLVETEHKWKRMCEAADEQAQKEEPCFVTAVIRADRVFVEFHHLRRQLNTEVSKKDDERDR